MVSRDGERLRRRHGLDVRTRHEAPPGRLAQSGGRAEEEQDNDGKSLHGVRPQSIREVMQRMPDGRHAAAGRPARRRPSPAPRSP